VQQPEGKPEPESRKVPPKLKLIQILVVVGALVAMLGSAILPPGVWKLLVGTVALALVLAALALLTMGRSPTGMARSPGAPAKSPPSELEDDQPPSPSREDLLRPQGQPPPRD
jgi:hypothetical protein